jgi:hypothetical protein
MSYWSVQYAPILCTFLFIKYPIFYFLFEFFLGGVCFFPSLYLFAQLILLALWKKRRSIIVVVVAPTHPISFFFWEQKPQDVNPGAAAELTRSVKARSVVVV